MSNERKQVPEHSFSDEIARSERKPCGHIAECDCATSVQRAVDDAMKPTGSQPREGQALISEQSIGPTPTSWKGTQSDWEEWHRLPDSVREAIQRSAGAATQPQERGSRNESFEWWWAEVGMKLWQQVSQEIAGAQFVAREAYYDGRLRLPQETGAAPGMLSRVAEKCRDSDEGRSSVRESAPGAGEAAGSNPVAQNEASLHTPTSVQQPLRAPDPSRLEKLVREWRGSGVYYGECSAELTKLSYVHAYQLEQALSKLKGGAK